MKVIKQLILLFCIIFSVFSCKKNTLDTGNNFETEYVKIGIILPKDNGKDNYIRTLNLVKENILKATNGRIEPVYQWIDESSADIRESATQLAKDNNIFSIIGCENDSNTLTLATICNIYKKPMFTFSTSEHITRKFNLENFMWGLSETDITQSEVLLALSAKRYNKKAQLIIPYEGLKNNSYKDWFGFQATELGLEPMEILTYSSADQISTLKEELGKSKPDCVILAPNKPDEAIELIKLINECNKMDNLFIDFYFNNVAHSRSIIKEIISLGYDFEYNKIKGVTLDSDPSSGFTLSYNAYFGENPSFGDAQIYDAVTISCYAYKYSSLHREEIKNIIDDASPNLENLIINKSIYKLLEKESTIQGGWMAGNITNIFNSIQNLETPALSGATGALYFSPKDNTTIQYSTYSYWEINKDKFINLAYYSRDEGSHSSSAVGSWEWNKIFTQDFDVKDLEINYPKLKNKWAIIIASSKGWLNYRHQADALAFYDLLKSNGYKDEHIITIMEDDIAYNTLNPQKGYISNEINGPNYYNNFILDYKLSETSLSDLSNILLGINDDGKYKELLKSEYDDNLIIFWSGHGNDIKPHNLLWGQKEEITGEYMKRLLSSMKNNGKYRKLLFVVEACYAGGIAKSCEGIEGLLFFTSANEFEQSFGDIHDNNLNVYRSNRFSKSFINKVRNNNHSYITDIYYSTFKETMGSHVTLYNYKNFGNIYYSNIGEFIIK